MDLGFELIKSLFVHHANHHVAFDFGLATKAGGRSRIVENIQAFLFITVRGLKVRGTLDDFTVTSGTGAEPTTGMLNGYPVRERDVEDRLAGFHFTNDTTGQKLHFRHAY